MANDFITPKYDYVVHDKIFSQKLPGVVYISSIKGRDSSESVWDTLELGSEPFVAKQLVIGLENHFNIKDNLHRGVPIVAVAIRNWTNVFRFGDPRFQENESNMYRIGSAKTDDVIAGNMQFDTHGPLACIGELKSLDEELHRWANADSVDSYLDGRMDWETDQLTRRNIEVYNPNKLKEHFMIHGL